MIFIDFNLYSILSLFYSYFYLYLYLFIYLFFGHEETNRHLFGGKINGILKRGDFIFRGTSHILLPCGDWLQEGKKRKKERKRKKGKKGEKEVGFSFSARRFLFEKWDWQHAWGDGRILEGRRKKE